MEWVEFKWPYLTSWEHLIIHHTPPYPSYPTPHTTPPILSHNSHHPTHHIPHLTPPTHLISQLTSPHLSYLTTHATPPILSHATPPIISHTSHHPTHLIPHLTPPHPTLAHYLCICLLCLPLYPTLYGPEQSPCPHCDPEGEGEGVEAHPGGTWETGG